MEGSSHRNKISIHPPREGWDVGFQRRGKRDNISIHPPREGWDCVLHIRYIAFTHFNPPTP